MAHMTECEVVPPAPPAAPEKLRGADYAYLGLAGAGCPNCRNRIRNALLACPGVVEVSIDESGALAQVWYATSEITVEGLVTQVAAAGEGTHHRYMAVPVGSLFERRDDD
jgi:copper chaperone CopZ